MNLNKVMSMIIGAAVVSSIVPATAVNASIKLEVLDGTINEAKAFANGRYVFDGYKYEDQDSGIYFFDGEKDVEIEDAETMGSKYGMNYINFKDDEIMFNLLSGQAEEDDEQSKLDMMETKFRISVVKKADRYKNTQNITNKGKIVEDTYCGVWYEYELTGDSTDEKYTVYLSDTGKYIDVSETLNVDYYKDNKKITLNSYDDLAENGLKVLFEKALILDQENIYKLVVISPDGSSQGTDDEISTLNLDSSLTGALEALSAAIDSGYATAYVQKISMEQGSKEDGAYLPKKVTSFETYDFDVVEFLLNNILGNNTARVSGSNLYTMELNDSHNKITMKKYSMKKIKDKTLIEGKTVDRRVLELDEDFDAVKDEEIQAYDVDVTGNLWTLNKGKIKKFENGKLETKYTVDRVMDNLSVFAENSLIAWNTEHEIYSVVAPVKEEENVEEEVENPSENDGSDTEVEFKTGWIKNEDGTWNFKNEDGNLATGWLKDNGTWYYLNTQGTMQTGWIKDGSTWYYLNASGAMQTGWVKVGSEWYYLNASGAMQTGWLKDTNGKWYYLYDSGAMAHSTVIDGYKLDASGAWIQ